MSAGGKGANSAAAVARLGGHALVIGCIGDDDLGRFELAGLEAADIDTRGVTVVADADTAVAIILVEEDGQNAVLIADSTNELLTGALVESSLQPHWHQIDALLVNFECAPEAVQAAVTLGRRHRVPVFVDPAPAQFHSPALWGGATALVPNRSEAAALVGFELIDQDTIHGAAQQLKSAGPTAIAVKLGAEGAYLLSDEDAMLVPALDVQAVDSTGAGDAFSAALVVASIEGKSWPEAVRFANAGGALATTRFGTIEAMPTRDEVEALLSRQHLPPR
jgi:ribokinase